jgi:hypothetical protein
MTALLRPVGYLVTIAMCSSSLAQSVNFDAQVVRIPTVRSELKRGTNDAFWCTQTVSDITSGQEYAQCIGLARRNDERIAPSSEYYILGLYEYATDTIKPMLEPSVTRLHRKYETTFAKGMDENWQKELNKAIASTKLSKMDYCNGIEAPDVKKCAESPF